MINVKSYIKQQARDNLRPLIFIMVACLAFCFFIGISIRPHTRYHEIIQDYVSYYPSTLYLPVIVLCVLSFILPVMQFHTFKKRRNLDCYYALPISRRALCIVHYFTGLVMQYITFTLSYIVNILIMLGRGVEYFTFSPLIGHYLLCLLMGWVMYSFVSFIYNEANTDADGIMFVILWSFVISFVLLTLDVFISDTDLNIYLGIPFASIDTITTQFQLRVEGWTDGLANLWGNHIFLTWFIVWICIGAATAALLFLTFGKRRTEKTEDISDSPIGYRAMIPTYTFCGMALTDEAIFGIIVIILTAIGYTIYRRGFKYKKTDVLSAVIVSVLGLAVSTLNNAF